MVQDKLHEVWSIEIILLQTSLGELVLERKEKGLIHGFYPLHFPIGLIVKSDSCPVLIPDSKGNFNLIHIIQSTSRRYFEVRSG